MNRIFLIALSVVLISPMTVNSDDRIYETKNICGLYYAADIFAMMGSTTEVISLGLQYTNVIFSGSVVFISVVALNSLLHAEGDTKTFRNVLILSFILNQHSHS